MLLSNAVTARGVIGAAFGTAEAVPFRNALTPNLRERANIPYIAKNAMYGAPGKDGWWAASRLLSCRHLPRQRGPVSIQTQRLRPGH